MKLWQARVTFTALIAELPEKAIAMGLRAAFDEGMERLTAKDQQSDHMKDSLHHSGLAMDVILYTPDGTYLSDTRSYEILGAWWEGLHKDCKWGGHFGDGNHFSFAPPEIAGSRK